MSVKLICKSKNKKSERSLFSNKAEWVETSTVKEYEGKQGKYTRTHKVYHCSKCGYKSAILTRYCPDCGRKCLNG